MSIDTSPERDQSLIQDLRALDAVLIGSGANKNDRADLLINTCIGHGITAGPKIVATLVYLGFDQRHVGARLGGAIKVEPVWPYWGRHEDGTYYAAPAPSPEP